MLFIKAVIFNFFQINNETIFWNENLCHLFMNEVRIKYELFARTWKNEKSSNKRK
jgi:hypothetical protein